MANNAVTRADLADALHQNLGLARRDCAQLLEDVLNEISDCLARDEPVKLTGFGSFLVRHKKERMARKLYHTNLTFGVRPSDSQVATL